MSESRLRVVWKYALTEPGRRFEMPIGARILAVETQDGTPTLWALVDPRAELEQRLFVGVGTGMNFDYSSDMEYIGTAHNVEGQGLVFHIFEVHHGT